MRSPWSVTQAYRVPSCAWSASGEPPSEPIGCQSWPVGLQDRAVRGYPDGTVLIPRNGDKRLDPHGLPGSSAVGAPHDPVGAADNEVRIVGAHDQVDQRQPGPGFPGFAVLATMKRLDVES